MGSETLPRYMFGSFKNYIRKLNMSKIKCKKTTTQIYLQKLMIKINNLKKINKKKNKTYNDDVDISLKIKQMYVLQI